MGRANGDLIKAAEKARKLHGETSHQYQKAARLVAASQASCLHDGERRQQRLTHDSSTGKYCKDQVITVCMECSQILD